MTRTNISFFDFLPTQFLPVSYLFPLRDRKYFRAHGNPETEHSFSALAIFLCISNNMFLSFPQFRLIGKNKERSFPNGVKILIDNPKRKSKSISKK